MVSYTFWTVKRLMAGALLLAAGLAPGAAPAADKIPLSVPADYTAFCLGMDILRSPAFPRFREKYDIDFENIQMQISQVPVAISNQDIAIGACSGISTIMNAWNKGAKNLIVFAVGSKAPIYQLITKAEIQKLEDLKGKSIGIPGLQSASTEAVEMIMKRGANMAPGTDYNFVSAGAGSARVASLIAGAIDGLPTYPPHSYELARQGFKILADEVTYVPEYVTGVHIVSREWAEANEDVFVRLIKGIVETSMWLKEPANRDEVVAWLAANFPGTGNEPIGQEDAAKLYDFVIKEDRLSFDGYATEGAVRANLGIMKERGFITDAQIPPLGQVFDFSYLNKALKELNLPLVTEYPTK